MDSKTIIETRQRAEEMIRQAILVWQNSDFADDLDGLDSDPVFRMLMTALASQFNGIDSEIESLRQQVMDDFAEMFIPYEVDNEVPASLLIETMPSEGVADVLIDGKSTFTERSSGLKFMPLLRTRALNASIRQVSRLDGRRWKVSVDFPEGITSLDWFTFAIDGLSFRDLTIWYGNRELNIIKPWNQHDLPYNEAFDFPVRLYNQSPVLNSLYICMDILAERDICLYCMAEQEDLTFDESLRTLDFVFEFMGIDENFVLEKNRLHLNVCPVLNVQIDSVTMTADQPVVRVSDDNGRKFLKLMPPSDEQVFSRYNVYVRKVMADRFNVSGLIRLLDCLRNKFHTDYYAFQMIKKQDGDAMMRGITSILDRLRDMALSSGESAYGGIYLFLKNEDDKVYKVRESFDVRYLTTSGDLPDGSVARSAILSTPVGLDNSKTRQIMDPLIWQDNKSANIDRRLLAAYYIATSDRLVTPADIRMFCVNYLILSIPLDREMVHQTSVIRRRSERSAVGFEIHVDITLLNNTIVRKAVGNRLSKIELVLENMLRARSINIYPISVTIQMK